MGVASSRGRDGRRGRVDGMARGAGEPSAKRAKVDEEEDPLVRRKEEVVRLLERASAKGKGNARAKKELVTLCADFEAKNEKLLGRLLPELWQKILDQYLHQNDLLALAMTCRFFRDTTKDLGKKLETSFDPEHLDHLVWLYENGKVESHSLDWFRWVCDTFEILPGFPLVDKRNQGAVSEGILVNYAALQSSDEILKWLIEKEGYELNEQTEFWAGMGGSLDVLEYMNERGYEFTSEACAGAASGGSLMAFMWLRDQDPPCPWDEGTCSLAVFSGRVHGLRLLRSLNPPCPWDEETCAAAAWTGVLFVLEWARDQDPPCPWDERTCSEAARGGNLDVLKWARSQDPPCPWNHETCEEAAKNGHLEVLKWARDQDPPCPADGECCRCAAEGGHLEILKWLRDQDPPCPWSRRECKDLAMKSCHEHIVLWIDQQEDDESDLSDSDSDVESYYSDE